MTTILDWITKTHLCNPENKTISSILNICKKLKLGSSLTAVLVETIINNDEESFLYLLEQNIDLNMPNENSLTPIMFASKMGRNKMVEKLLSKQVDISDDDDNHLSALKVALVNYFNCYEESYITCIKLLIKAGANIEFVSYAENAYKLAKVLKRKVDSENIVTNNEPDTYVTNDGTIVIIPQKIEKPKLIIKMLYNQNKTIPCITEQILYATWVEININGNWLKHGLNPLDNCYIEFPLNVNDKIGYHYLPAGVTLDGIPTTENYVCKFNNSINLMDKGEVMIKQCYT